ncbi:MAG: tetratricopeptide repeat protein [Candidatus Omnitrophica bacterium]|nr:tetratricopeptide repeat protein [Candidatus Omnitrophota bacterium]
MNKVLLINALLILIALAVFSQVVHHDFFVIDDLSYVRDNPHIRQGITWEAVHWAFTADLLYDSPHTDYWQPVTLLSRILDVALYGLNPAGHHATNLFLHCLNVILLFLLFRRMTGRTAESAFVAAIFAVHPFQVEPVAWITARKDLLSAFFGLLAILAYTRFTRRRSLLRYLVLCAAYLLSLMSKPMLITLPFVLLLIDFWPLERKKNSTIFLEKIPLCLLAIPFAFIATQGPNSAFFEVPADRVFLQIPISYVWYLWKFFWPTQMCFRSPDLLTMPPLWLSAETFLFLALISILLLYQHRKRPHLAFGWLWFLSTISPMISLIPTGDRFMYIPLIGLAVMVAWGANEVVASPPQGAKQSNALRTGLVAITVGVLAFLTFAQTAKWKTSTAFLEHSLKAGPKNYLAEYNLGVAYFRQREYEKALEHYAEVLKAWPERAFVHDNMGLAYFRTGKLEEARKSFESAVALDPSFEEARLHLEELRHIEKSGVS